MITIDPGVNGCGWAWWGAAYLIQAGYGQPPSAKETREDLLIELPQIYSAMKSKGNPNNLIKLAFHAGMVVNGRPYETVSPRQWKGTIKKEVMLKRILSKLTDTELSLLKGLGLPKSLEHNVVDACGIGLWKLGRL